MFRSNLQNTQIWKITKNGLVTIAKTRYSLSHHKQSQHKNIIQFFIPKTQPANPLKLRTHYFSTSEKTPNPKSSSSQNEIRKNSEDIKPKNPIQNPEKIANKDTQNKDTKDTKDAKDTKDTKDDKKDTKDDTKDTKDDKKDKKDKKDTKDRKDIEHKKKQEMENMEPFFKELKNEFARILELETKNLKIQKQEIDKIKKLVERSKNGKITDFYKESKQMFDEMNSPLQFSMSTSLMFVLVIALAICLNLKNRLKPVESEWHPTFSKFARDYVARGKVEKITVFGKVASVVLKTDTPKLGFFQTSPSTKNTKDNLNEEFGEQLDDCKEETEVVESSPQNLIMFRQSIYLSPVKFEDFVEKMEKLQTELGVPKENFIEIKWVPPLQSNIPTIIACLISISLALSLYFATKNMSGIMGSVFKTNKFTSFKAAPSISKTTLADVAGLKSAKVEIKEFINYLKNKKDFDRVGARLPKGALLIGPPGTGKTLLAKAIAGESKRPFYSVSGSEFVETFVGVGPARVRSLFKKARETAPSIIFIDEIDAIGRKRDGGVMRGNTERESTLNQLLIEMDGFNDSTGVIVFAGTNMAESLDSALMRSGRFDRKIGIGLPDLEEREEIFVVHLKPLKLNKKPDEIAKKMAALTPNFSGADIANVCNEAAIIAGRENSEFVAISDFLKACDRVIAGLERSKMHMSPRDRESIAYHEAGHAVAGWFLEYADPLLKVTIKPRAGGVMGFAQYLPKEISLIKTWEIRDKIAMALGGRISELIFFGHLSTGATNDLQQVTKMAYSYVKELGFSEKLGSFAFRDNPMAFLPKAQYSKKTGDLIDSEVQKLVADVFENTMQMMKGKKSEIENLALALLEKENLNHNDVVKVLGPRPFVNENYKKYLDGLKEVQE